MLRESPSALSEAAVSAGWFSPAEGVFAPQPQIRAMDKRHAVHAERIFLFKVSSVIKMTFSSETISDYNTQTADFNMKMIFKFIFSLLFSFSRIFSVSAAHLMKESEKGNPDKRGRQT
jgi:hypothetical protein